MDRRGAIVYLELERFVGSMVWTFLLLISSIVFFALIPIYFEIIIMGFLMLASFVFVLIYILVLFRNYPFKAILYGTFLETRNLYGKVLHRFKKDEIKSVKVENVRIKVRRGSIENKSIVIYFVYGSFETILIDYEKIKDVTDYIVVPYSKKSEKLIRSYVGKIE